MPEPTQIVTGVDKLMAIVARDQKVSLQDAANELSVPLKVVQDWADFLEEEGLISLEYTLMNTFLVRRRLTPEQLKEKKESYDRKKEAFIRKVDTALKQLEQEGEKFAKIEDRYEKLRETLGSNLDEVQEEVAELQHYEELKKSFDQDLINNKLEYEKTVEQMRKKLGKEEGRFNEILQEISQEVLGLKQDSMEVSDLEKEENVLTSRIDALQNVVNSVVNRLRSEEERVKSHQDRITHLRELAQRVQEDIIERKKRQIEPLVKICSDQEKKIIRIQNEIMDKVKRNVESMKDYKQTSDEIQKQFGEFFQKRADVEKTMHDLEHINAEMKQELVDLVSKAKAFDLSNSSSTNRFIAELEHKYRDFEQKRSQFSSEMGTLSKLLVSEQQAAEVAAHN